MKNKSTVSTGIYLSIYLYCQTHLLIDGSAIAVDEPSTDAARDEAIEALRFPTVELAHQLGGRLVQHRKRAQLDGMLPCGPVDGVQPLLKSAPAKEESGDYGMGEADLGAVHQSIAAGLS